VYMKRSLIQFDEETYQKLRQRAFQQERSISSLVREIVVKSLDGHAGRAQTRRVSQFLSVAAGRSQQGRLSPISEKHDEALAATFEK
jgi:plasmid stability protein